MATPNHSVSEFSADARQFGEDALASLEAALKAHGLYIYVDPRYAESDTYGFLISNWPMTAEAVADFVKEE